MSRTLMGWLSGGDEDGIAMMGPAEMMEGKRERKISVRVEAILVVVRFAVWLVGVMSWRGEKGHRT